MIGGLSCTVYYILLFMNPTTAVGLGHVDATSRGEEGQGMHRSRCVQNISLRLQWSEHELLLPGYVLQEACAQCTA